MGELVQGHPAHGPDIVLREANGRQFLAGAFDLERREGDRDFARLDVSTERTFLHATSWWRRSAIHQLDFLESGETILAHGHLGIEESRGPV